ncbi:MAG: HD domain-containing protein [Bacteroidia bacterium]|nr:HD domain-containing protein [Bacteroidia bacterium]HQU99783.1 HD domain-containing protein [Bacteroidia bacterium]
MSKQKIYNDPVYGFITIPTPLVAALIAHPFFQRLRNIKQLGLTHYVYPGALHTRFHHALGAMHLTMQAIETLRSKGVAINDDEAEALIIAVLLHDMGHGPFSHALENAIVQGVQHEWLSLRFMQHLNLLHNGKLQMAMDIFMDVYPKKFLHQLVSGQLDMDRLDYLNRDSFFTGVTEGVVSSDRIIKMLDVYNDTLVVEQKGIYSVEKFITARRLMYWQVYLHKTVLAAENLLLQILKRARFLAFKGHTLFATPAFTYFLTQPVTQAFFEQDEVLQQFALLDDTDVFASVKVWCNSTDKVLALLCSSLVNRNLYKTTLQTAPIESGIVQQWQTKAVTVLGIKPDDAAYFAFAGTVANNAYQLSDENIHIMYKDGTLLDIAQASDNLNISVLAQPVVKHFLCLHRNLF